MPFQLINKKHAISIIGIFLLILFLTTYKASAQIDLGGTDPKVVCTQSFCLAVWKSSASTLVGRILDNYGGTKVDIDFGPLPSGAYFIVEPGGSKILVAYIDPASGKDYYEANLYQYSYKIYNFAGFLLDSSGQKTSLPQLQDSQKPTSANLDAAYNPSTNSFLIDSGHRGINIDVASNSVGTIQHFEPFPRLGTITYFSFSSPYSRIIYDKTANNFYDMRSQIYTSLSGLDPVTGAQTYSTIKSVGGFNNYPYSEDGDLIYNSKDSSSVLIYTNNNYIFVYKSPFTSSSTPKIRGFTGLGLPTSANPNPESISSKPLSFDLVNNKYILAFSRGGIGYIQAMDSTLANSGSEISLASVLSPPSITYDPSSGKHLAVFATTTGIQTRYIDVSTANPAVFTTRTYTKSEDGETSLYTVFDNTNTATLVTGSRRFADVQASFENPTWKTRLKGTLEFSKTDVDLSTLVIEATDTATAVNKIGTKGLANKILLIPNTNNGAGVRACPYATTVTKITQNCLGELVFNGPFPEKQGNVEVKVASLSASPLAHWSFDTLGNNYQFADSKGNTPGTGSPVSNGPILADDGKFGKALKLDGMDDVVTVEDKPNAALDPISGITVSAWIFLDSRAGNQYKTVLRKPPSANGDPFGLYSLHFNNLNEKIEFLISKGLAGSAKTVLSKESIPLQTWTLVTGTWDGTNIKLFVDGILQNTAAFSGPIGTNDLPLYIGKDQGQSFFAGKLDDVFVYNKALTDQQVKKLNDDYQTEISGLLNQPEVLFYEISGLSGSGAILLGSTTTTSTPTPTSTAITTPSTTPTKIKAQLSLTRSFLTQDNKKVEVKASYKKETASADEVVINGAFCKIKYSDKPGQEYEMVFETDQYKYERLFNSAPSNVEATVTCSHASYTEETKKITLSASQSTSSPSPTTSLGGSPSPTPIQPTVKLSTPENNKVVGTDVTFVCTAAGSNLREISFYTDIGGSFRKYKTETVTGSPATKQFKVQNIAEGSYKWNCETKSSAGTYRASSNRTIEVKAESTEGDADCIETKDCQPWEPADCPSNGIQTRSCSEVRLCGYPLSRSCIYSGGPTSTPVPEDDQEGGRRISTQKPKGADITLIIVIVVLIIAILGGLLFFLKRRGLVESNLFSRAGE